VLGYKKDRSERSLNLRKQRSIENKAMEYCFRHSKFDAEMDESVFLQSSEDTVFFVKIAVQGVCADEVPETPQGLVLTDSRGRGGFQ
jgi:hypothetical protein